MIFNRIMSSLIRSKTRIQPDYDACIELLNTLQSNAAYIKSAPKNHTTHNIIEVQNLLQRTGMSLNKLDELSVIHVAGTKGKGTTCAFSESILRHHGYKTGFFSSPHLVEVRERIRINGQPIDKNEFAHYFWNIYTKLDQTKMNEHDMPLYFRFLTIMAFTIFLEKHVDVAIIEVGIGGEHDCTNVLRKVPVVGITSLGIDHTQLLGNTLETIAWNKAGIMKNGCQAFTVPQNEVAMKVLEERSKEKNCTLQVVESLNFKFHDNNRPASVLNLNAGLAVALCNAWITSQKQSQLSKSATEKGIEDCVWPGRFQIIRNKNLTFYLDGAHTVESIDICANWFTNMTKKSKKRKILMFNITGSRNSVEILRILMKCHFDGVLFVTNNANAKADSLDNINYQQPTDNQLEKCQQHKKIWLELQETYNFETKFVEVFPTVSEAVTFLNSNINSELLVTGSLHLIGAVLSVIGSHVDDN